MARSNFCFTDLPVIAPCVTQETCPELAPAALFTPRVVPQEIDPEMPLMNLHHLIALTASQELLRWVVTVD